MPFKSILDLKEEKTSRAIPYSNGITVKVFTKGTHRQKQQEWVKARIDVPNAIEESAV